MKIYFVFDEFNLYIFYLKAPNNLNWALILLYTEPSRKPEFEEVIKPAVSISFIFYLNCIFEQQVNIALINMK